MCPETHQEASEIIYGLIFRVKIYWTKKWRQQCDRDFNLRVYGLIFRTLKSIYYTNDSAFSTHYVNILCKKYLYKLLTFYPKWIHFYVCHVPSQPTLYYKCCVITEYFHAIMSWFPICKTIKLTWLSKFWSCQVANWVKKLFINREFGENKCHSDNNVLLLVILNRIY